MKTASLELSKNEALVLVDLLIRYRDNEKFTVEHEADNQIMYDLCAMLESQVPELLVSDYKEKLNQARLVVANLNNE